MVLIITHKAYFLIFSALKIINFILLHVQQLLKQTFQLSDQKFLGIYPLLYLFIKNTLHIEPTRDPSEFH